MQRTADFPDLISGTYLPPAARVLDHATALDAAVDVLDADATACDAPIHGFLCVREGLAPRLLDGPAELDVVERACQKAAVLAPPAARGQGGGRGLRHPLVVDTARRGGTQTEDRERRVDQEHRLHRMACFLTTITAPLCKRVLGAREAPFGAIVANRGAVGARTGATADRSAGVDSSAVGTHRAAASASVTPTRGASAGKARLGASPSGHRAPCRTPNRV
jgi:hypothetical protein